MSLFNEQYNQILDEHFDIEHRETRKVLFSIDEADQDRVLCALASKLYDSIIDKVDDIDFGSIPESKGDITKIDGYEKLLDCLNTMEEMLNQYKQSPKPVQSIKDAIDNVVSRKELFEKAFRYNIELPIVVYSTVVLAIVSSTSYLIANTVEFIREPQQEDFSAVISKMALMKSKQNLLFRNLDKFNTSCKNGDLDRSMQYVISNRVKKLTGIDDVGLMLGIAGIVGILLNIIPLIRELIYFFYSSKVRVSDYLDLQADLLQMSAYNVKNNSQLNKVDRERIAKKQSKIADIFKTLSNKLSVNLKKSEVNAQKSMTTEKKKYKTDEILDSVPDSAGSALF